VTRHHLLVNGAFLLIILNCNIIKEGKASNKVADEANDNTYA